MAILSFSLSPEATGRIYELLICLAKFGESVSIEARSEKARLRRDSCETSCINVSAVHDYRVEPFADSICLVCIGREDVLSHL